MKPSIIANVTIETTSHPSKETYREILRPKSFGFNWSESFLNIRRAVEAWVERTHPGAIVIDVSFEGDLPIETEFELIETNETEETTE